LVFKKRDKQNNGNRLSAVKQVFFLSKAIVNRLIKVLRSNNLIFNAVLIFLKKMLNIAFGALVKEVKNSKNVLGFV
jgi:hypothetical protein